MTRIEIIKKSYAMSERGTVYEAIGLKDSNMIRIDAEVMGRFSSGKEYSISSYIRHDEMVVQSCTVKAGDKDDLVKESFPTIENLARAIGWNIELRMISNEDKRDIRHTRKRKPQHRRARTGRVAGVRAGKTKAC